MISREEYEEKYPIHSAAESTTFKEVQQLIAAIETYAKNQYSESWGQAMLEILDSPDSNDKTVRDILEKKFPSKQDTGYLSSYVGELYAATYPPEAIRQETEAEGQQRHLEEMETLGKEGEQLLKELGEMMGPGTLLSQAAHAFDVLSNTPSPQKAKGKAAKKDGDCVVAFCSVAEYENPLLNHPELLQQALSLGLADYILSSHLSLQEIKALLGVEATSEEGSKAPQPTLHLRTPGFVGDMCGQPFMRPTSYGHPYDPDGGPGSGDYGSSSTSSSSSSNDIGGGLHPTNGSEDSGVYGFLPAQE